MEFTFKEVMDTYRRMYGGKVWNFSEFQTFEEAFRAAWQSFDFITNATTLEEFAEGMAECWELTDPGPDPLG